MKNKKKILYTATVDSHILSFHIPFLKMLKEEGYEVHVATNGDTKIPYCDVKHKICFERNPFKINNLKAIKQLKKVLEKEKFDIIHCHTPMGSVVTRIAAKKTRKEGTRLIYTAHGFHFYKGAPILNWLLFYPVEWYLAKFTDILITINKEDYERAKRKFSKRCSDIQYVPGVGIDPKKFDFEMTDEEKNKLRESLKLEKDDFIIIYPAEISSRKRQKWLINSLKNVIKENKKIHILLPGKDSLKGKCQKLIKKFGISNQVHILGFRNDIPKLLKISNMSISSSKQEGLPVNLIEAAYNELTIVATKCRGNTDLLENLKGCYLIDVNDKLSFSNSIYEVYKNSTKKNQNKEYIEQYKVDKILIRLKEIYLKKCKNIVLLRSTEIYNDSRATKEINTYSKIFDKVIVIGWNRSNIDDNVIKNSLPNNAQIYLYNCKSTYGSGFKNIFKILKYNIWIYKTLLQNKEYFKIIHACDFDTAFIAKKMAKKYNKKLIYDVYDYYCDCHKLGIIKNVIEKVDINILNYADYVLLCTEQRKKQISRSKPKNIEIIHNSPIIEKKLIFENYEPKNSQIIIGYFGILQDDRLLLEITNKLKENNKFKLVVGGFGKYEYFFKECSKKYKNIEYLGSLKYEDVIRQENKCNLLFATYNPQIKNHRYSAPNKVYEAMALGKPIIVCKNTGIDDIVNNEKIGVAIDYSANKFFDNIEKALNLKDTMSVEIFREKYSWEIMEDRLKKVISNLE